MGDHPLTLNFSNREENMVPTKPTQEVIDAAKVNLNSKEVLEVVINEEPSLRAELLKGGLVEEVED